MNATRLSNESSPVSRITLRQSDQRGHVDHGWLDARHSFSFGNYYDPDHMSYGSLRVINEDVVAPGKGFAMHPHSEMEIFTYIISGQLKHEDSMGNSRIIKSGEFQYMSAGSGVLHSENNPSNDEEVHLLQIWITPNQRGGEPLYADMDTKTIVKDKPLTLFASGDGRDGSQIMRQDAEIYFGQLNNSSPTTLLPGSSYQRHYLQLIQGKLQLEGHVLHPGDAAMIDGSPPSVQSLNDTSFIYFNL